MNKYHIVQLALQEDLGNGDVSVQLLSNKIISAQVVCNEKAVICGLDYFEQAFLLLDKNIDIKWQIQSGQQVKPNQVLCHIIGNSQSIISAERVALNFLQTLSATATKTRQLVDKIAHTHTKILDTRKTLPNLRIAQKEAVVCGGGVNNRLGLYDVVMLKENHLSVMGGLCELVKKAQKIYPNLAIILEVETLKQLKQALGCSVPATRILCDNFTIQQLTDAVQLTDKKIPLEASGNINEHNILGYVQTGVDYVSIGMITKNIQSIDLSLRFL